MLPTQEPPTFNQAQKSVMGGTFICCIDFSLHKREVWQNSAVGLKNGAEKKYSPGNSFGALFETGQVSDSKEFIFSSNDRASNGYFESCGIVLTLPDQQTNSPWEIFTSSWWYSVLNHERVGGFFMGFVSYNKFSWHFLTQPRRRTGLNCLWIMYMNVYMGVWLNGGKTPHFTRQVMMHF